MKLLCLSNGHGEDVIAVRILRQLQQLPYPLEIFALPIVGEGYAYQQLENVAIIGPVQPMPSGGFIYMDGRQLFRDVKSGLLQLTWSQDQAIREWTKSAGSNLAILAVGDIVPLLFAWRSGLPYAFVGTAKSEYYLQDESGPLASLSSSQTWAGWGGSVYQPWEQWLMRHRRCRVVFPRDQLTAKNLQRLSIPALDLGNPMMDDLEPDYPIPALSTLNGQSSDRRRSLIITLLPGSRAPEAYGNWQVILEGVAGILEKFHRSSLVFLGAIAPALNLEALEQVLEVWGWQKSEPPGSASGRSIIRTLVASGLGETLDFKLQPSEVTLTQKNATMILTQRAFNECLHRGDLAIAMAGTATEQFVGLGKPAITLPGQGPQFTPAFAEAQSRLLGPSVIPVKQPSKVVHAIQYLLSHRDRWEVIAENGRRRMGVPGASRRIAQCLVQKLW